MSSPRYAKISEQIKEIIARMLERRIKDPRLGFVTITDVRITGDGREATVFYTVLGGADDQFFLIKYQGQEPHALRYADHGANIVGMTILTQLSTIRDKPDMVRRFVRASVRSWEESKKNPKAAVEAALKVKPDLNAASTLDQMLVDFELLDSANSKGRIGFGAQKDWEQTLDLLKQYRELQTNQPWTAFHTNEFMPSA